MMILCWSIICKTPTCGTQHLIAEAISPPDAALDFLCDDCGQQYTYAGDDYRPHGLCSVAKGIPSATVFTGLAVAMGSGEV